MKPRICGIYMIRNDVMGRVYVGSSVNVTGRWFEHRSLLRADDHHNRFLQNSWNKHGERAFSFHLLEVVENGRRLQRREDVWIAAFPDRYNIGSTASPTRGTKMTPEVIARCSEGLRRSWANKTKAQRDKMVAARTEYHSSMTAARRRQINANIAKANGRRAGVVYLDGTSALFISQAEAARSLAKDPASFCEALKRPGGKCRGSLEIWVEK